MASRQQKLDRVVSEVGVCSAKKLLNNAPMSRVVVPNSKPFILNYGPSL